jgi:hypothetical protein
MLYTEKIAVCSQIHTKHINTLRGWNVEFENVTPGGIHSNHRAVNGQNSVIKSSQLKLYREIIAVCSQIHTKHINTLCGWNVEFDNVKPGGKNSNHWAFKVYSATHCERHGDKYQKKKIVISHSLISGKFNLKIKHEYVPVQLYVFGRTNLTVRVKEHALSLTLQSS